MMKDEDFKLLKGFALRRTNRRTDICDCRVAFATENFDSLILKLNEIFSINICLIMNEWFDCFRTNWD